MGRNNILIAARLARRLSQDDLAQLLRAHGAPGASKRQVQRWERGLVDAPWPSSARALEQVFGVPIEQLGFTGPGPRGHAVPDGRGGHDVTMAAADAAEALRHPAGGEWSGIWESRYEYYSSSRARMCASDAHRLLVLQHGRELTVRSLPGPSLITMTLVADGQVVTGTWQERTDPDGYYAGALYHGAIQMLVDPTGRRMSGKWLGFGRAMEINSGPWDLTWRDGSTSRAAIDRWCRR